MLNYRKKIGKYISKYISVRFQKSDLLKLFCSIVVIFADSLVFLFETNFIGGIYIGFGIVSVIYIYVTLIVIWREKNIQ